LPVAQQQQGAGPSGTSLLSLCCSSRRAGSKEQVLNIPLPNPLVKKIWLI